MGNNVEKLTELYRSLTGTEPSSVTPVAAGGSGRRYFLMEGSPTLIGAVGENADENRAFIYFASALAARGLRVPQVVAASGDGVCYLQTWEGKETLFDRFSACQQSGNWDSRTIRIMETVVDALAAFHGSGTDGIDFSRSYPQGAESTRQSAIWDLNYFKYCFLKPAGIDFDEGALEADFAAFADAVQALGCGETVLRDCQSRNMVLDATDEVTFIDFQGARPGCGLYDLVSFLWQARAALPDELRRGMVERYVSRRGWTNLDEAWRKVRFMALFRSLQVLGAYGFRGLTQRKEHFMRSIPGAIANVEQLLRSGVADPYPELKGTLERLCAPDRAARFSRKYGVHGRLTVTVGSFAYKNGLPEDESGNGGGFVFDCRCLHNPGKYERYRQLTGRDAPVASFLEERGEVGHFLDSVWNLVGTAVEKYRKRGFTSLSVWFGCTGGQHRSVYCAERLRSLLEAIPGVDVELHHREQNIFERYQGKMKQIKALVFAAGMGTRLGHITDTMPKALVPVGGMPMLGRVLTKLRAAGVESAVVNVHHFPQLITDYLEENGNFGMNLTLSYEKDRLLETGGGMLAARAWLADSDFIVHNADVLTDFDMSAMVESHRRSGADVTLLCQHRESARRFLFDGSGRLRGWKRTDSGQSIPEELDDTSLVPLCFGGVSIVSPTVFPLLEEYSRDRGETVFSTTPFYAAMADKLDIRAYEPAEAYSWIDVGSPETLAQAQTLRINDTVS